MTDWGLCCGGGGGGYTKTYRGTGYVAPSSGTWVGTSTEGRDGDAIAVTPGHSINIIVGAGIAATTGGYSQFLNSSYRASGGQEGQSADKGGNGGSGGSGAYGAADCGGSDGSNGVGGSNYGIGQGHTTRDFGEATGLRNAGVEVVIIQCLGESVIIRKGQGTNLTYILTDLGTICMVGSQEAVMVVELVRQFWTPQLIIETIQYQFLAVMVLYSSVTRSCNNRFNYQTNNFLTKAW